MNPILHMVQKDSLGNLYSFYRGIYKSVACGPMIGFRINGRWIYGSELPNTPVEELKGTVDGIWVKSIVEGSDVELDGYNFDADTFDPKAFWEAVTGVNEEARFYWERDNSTWVDVFGKHIGHLQETWGKFKWDNPNEIPGEDRGMIERFVSDLETFEYDTPYPVGEYQVSVWLNDTVF